MERLLTVEETARTLNIPKSWIYGKIHARSLPFPFVKIGHYVRIPEVEVLEYLERVTVSPDTVNDHLLGSVSDR